MMAVPKTFQNQVLAKIAKAQASGGKSLNLRGIKPTAAEATAWVVKQIQSQLPQLTTLDLGDYQIGDAAAVVERLPGLTTLDLVGRQIGDAGARVLAEGLPGLTTLDLVGRQIGDAGARALAEGLPQLTTLELAYNQIGDAGARALAEGLPRLTALHLWNNQIGDAGAVAIAEGLPLLTTLNLGKNQIGYAGAVAIAESLPLLTSLNLGRNQIGKVGARAIAERLPQLTTLTLWGNQIGEAGAVAIAEGLPQLTKLHLGRSQIGEAGAVAIARAIQAGHWPQLTQLGLGENGLSVDAAVLDSADPQQIADAILNGIIQPEVRIMFLGMGAVGKTWLYRRTFRKEIVDREAEQRRMTPDIDLIHPEACLWKPASLIPRVWDFAGQLITHGVHETFLASDGRTVCVLVLSAKRLPGENPDADQESNEGNELPYWLKTIEHFAGSEVPVVIAISQCDRPGERKLDRALIVTHESGTSESLHIPQTSPAQLKSLFQIEATAIVDQLSACDASLPIEPLRQAITAAASTLTAITRNKVPPKLPKLRDYVEGQLSGRTFVAVDEYRNWCRVNETTESREQETYLTIFRAMGSLFYFGRTPAEKEWIRDDREGYYRSLPAGQLRSAKQEPSAHLQSYVINPHWLKLAVYQVIRQSERRCWISKDEIEQQIAEANGTISGSHVARPPSEAETAIVIDFLKLVDLCYWDEERQEYLFPRGLPKGTDRGATNWPGTMWRWRYLSEAMFDRFIVDMHRRGHVVKEGKYWQHWRLAVLIKKEGCQTLVEVHPATGELSLRIDPDSEERTRSAIRSLVREEFVRLVGKEPAYASSIGRMEEPAQNPSGLESNVVGRGDEVKSLPGIGTVSRRTSAIRQFCLILAKQRFIGTAILVGDRRLLTNKHVYDEADRQDPTHQQWEAVFDFDSPDQTLDQLPRIPIIVPQSLVSSEAEAGQLDYAFIDLKEIPKGNRGFLTAHDRRPGKDEPIYLLTYRGDVATPGAAVSPLPWEERIGVIQDHNSNSKRLAYTATTSAGSSGSPVFNEEFLWIGLHHHGEKSANHGIPLWAIAADLRSKGQADLLTFG